MNGFSTAMAGACVLALVAGGPSTREGAAARAPFSRLEIERILRHSPLPPPPPDPTNAFADDPRAARLGQFLFFDERLSPDGGISCATCHVPDRAFADGRQVARGLAELERHTPTLWNVAYNRWLFWDGRSDSLWAQALQPIENERELGGNRLRTVHLIERDPELRKAYEAIFGALPDLSDSSRFPRDGRPVPEAPEHPAHAAWMSMREEDRAAVDRIFSNVGKAIAAYERRLVSRRSPFDTFVAGLRSGEEKALEALSESARRGLGLFVGKGGCRLCHVGPNFTDGEFHDIGVPPRRGGRPRDPGRHAGIERLLRDPFNARGRFSDEPSGAAAARLRFLKRGPETWGRFKTPSLRNVALTAPYMHQGQLATLRDVVRFYSTREGAVPAGHHGEQVLAPLNLTNGEIEDLVAFLESLTDRSLDPALLRQPATPLWE